MQIPCAVVFAEQPHFSFYVPSDKENDEIMVVDEHPVILTGFAARAHDQMQLDQFTHGRRCILRHIGVLLICEPRLAFSLKKERPPSCFQRQNRHFCL